MNIDLIDTNAAKISAAILDARRRSGNAAITAVLTLIIVTDEQTNYDALRAALEASRAHPSRILAVIPRAGSDSETRLDAEVRTGGEHGLGEVAVLRLYGELAHHAKSVVLPLLLPESPVVTWWPGWAPDVPADDELGALASRRITDVASRVYPLQELTHRATHYSPGDTDLAWTRITPWRALLASALDAPYAPITSGRVAGEPGSPSARLLRAWLHLRLGVPIDSVDSEGPGITEVVLRTESGEIGLTRADARLATLRRPGWPERSVALKRRPLADLLTEELRRLDPDDIYGATLTSLAEQPAVPAPRG